MANPGAYGVGRTRRIITDPFEERINLGLIPGVSPVSIVGQKPDIDTGTLPEDLWDPGGTYVFLAAATTLEVLSTNANDTAAGTGARTVFVNGLDANYNPLSATATLNGVGVVAVSGSFLRVNSFRVLTAGTALTNLGTITLRVNGGGATLSQIAVDYGLAFNGIYTVPAGLQLLPKRFTVSTLKAPVLVATLKVAVKYRPFGGAFLVASQFGLNSQGTSVFTLAQPPLLIAGVFPEKTDIKFTVLDVSANNVAVYALILGTLFPNSYQGTFS